MARKQTYEELEQSVRDLAPGDHLCLIYETEEERRSWLTPFFRQGLEHGEKVIYIVDARMAEQILNYLRDHGVETESYLESGQLIILTSDEVYMRERIFDPNGMIALLRDQTEQALNEGYSALRATGEMTWVLKGLPGSERLIEYEAKLNEFFPGCKCMGICQYDRRRFAPEILLDVLTTHPIVVIGTEMFENFYYMTAEDFLGPDAAEKRLKNWLDNIVERKRTEETLRESEERYRILFENANDAIFIADTITSIIIDANRQAEQLIGCPRQEIIGMHQSDLHPSHQAEYYKHKFREHVQKGRVFDLEAVVVRRMGALCLFS